MDPESNAHGLTLHRLVSSREPGFDALLKIYAEAHPACERKSLDKLRRMIERPDYFFLIQTLGSAVAAFCIACCFPNSDAALLEYMAVAADQRDRGIGSLLFRQTAKYDAISGRYLLIEVESDKVSSANEHLRRKRFYRRIGCREIEGLTYIMPPVSEITPPPMNMLVYRSTLPDSIEKPRLRNWLAACYSQVYHAPDDDRRIDLMLKSLPPAVRLI